MRWIVLLLLPLAGCVQDAPESTHAIYLLGLDPCHDGICWHDDDVGAFTHTLTINGLQTFAPGPNQDYWLQNQTLWGFDRDSREVRQITQNVVQLRAHNDVATFVYSLDETVWQFHWDDGFSRLSPPLGGAITLLDADANRALVSVVRNTTDLLLLDGAPQILALNTNARLGALYNGTVAFVQRVDGSDHAWVIRQDVISPLWTTSKEISRIDVAQGGLVVDVVDDTPRVAVWTPGATIYLATVPGQLLGVGNHVWVLEQGLLGATHIGRFDWKTGHVETVAPLAGPVHQSFVLGDRLVMVHDDTILELPTLAPCWLTAPASCYAAQ